MNRNVFAVLGHSKGVNTGKTFPLPPRVRIVLLGTCGESFYNNSRYVRLSSLPKTEIINVLQTPYQNRPKNMKVLTTVFDGRPGQPVPDVVLSMDNYNSPTATVKNSLVHGVYKLPRANIFRPKNPDEVIAIKHGPGNSTRQILNIPQNTRSGTSNSAKYSLEYIVNKGGPGTYLVAGCQHFGAVSTKPAISLPVREQRRLEPRQTHVTFNTYVYTVTPGKRVPFRENAKYRNYSSDYIIQRLSHIPSNNIKAVKPKRKRISSKAREEGTVRNILNSTNVVVSVIAPSREEANLRFLPGLQNAKNQYFPNLTWKFNMERSTRPSELLPSMTRQRFSKTEKAATNRHTNASLTSYSGGSETARRPLVIKIKLGEAGR